LYDAPYVHTFFENRTQIYVVFILDANFFLTK
jgi:hypothetical protein